MPGAPNRKPAAGSCANPDSVAVAAGATVGTVTADAVGRAGSTDPAVAAVAACTAVGTAALCVRSAGTAEAEALVRTILEMGPVAIRHVIEAVDVGYEMALDDALALEAVKFGLLSGTEDVREGMSAFLDKRKAAFRGR